MTSIRDAESAFMEGRIVFLEWQQEFFKEWYLPLYRAQLAAMAASMTPQEMALPGAQKVLPFVQQLVGGDNASTSPKPTLGLPWTGEGGRPTPPLPNSYQNSSANPGMAPGAGLRPR